MENEIQLERAAKKMRHFALIFIILFCLPPRQGHAQDVSLHEITVLADENLQMPLVEIARLYTNKNGTAVNLWFTNAVGMVDAIRDGADADIVITADRQALRTLEYLGQLDVYATQAVAESPLIIAIRDDERTVERDVKLELMGLKLRSKERFALVVINAQDRVEYAMTQQALAKSELLRDRPLELIAADDARDAKRLMAEHNAPALLLAGDAFSNGSLKPVQRFPTSVVAPAVYRAAVLAGDNMQRSRAFIDALRTTDYRNAWEHYGLSQPAPKPQDAKGQRALGS